MGGCIRQLRKMWPRRGPLAVRAHTTAGVIGLCNAIARSISLPLGRAYVMSLMVIDGNASLERETRADGLDAAFPGACSSDGHVL